jgi:hypothetical protein
MSTDSHHTSEQQSSGVKRAHSNDAEQSETAESSSSGAKVGNQPKRQKRTANGKTTFVKRACPGEFSSEGQKRCVKNKHFCYKEHWLKHFNKDYLATYKLATPIKNKKYRCVDRCPRLFSSEDVPELKEHIWKDHMAPSIPEPQDQPQTTNNGNASPAGETALATHRGSQEAPNVGDGNHLHGAQNGSNGESSFDHHGQGIFPNTSLTPSMTLPGVSMADFQSPLPGATGPFMDFGQGFGNNAGASLEAGFGFDPLNNVPHDDVFFAQANDPSLGS